MSSAHTTVDTTSGSRPRARHDRASQVRLLAAIASVLSLPLVGACSPTRQDRAPDTTAAGTVASGQTPATPAAAPVPDPVPAPVAGVGHHAENAYDMAKAANWPAARASTDSLRTAVRAIPDTGAAATTSAARESRLQVATTLASLDHAVTARNSSEALRASNRLTELGARLAAPYNPRVPADVTLLDYYGRELEVWSAAKDNGKLRATASAMRRTWDALRARVEARGGTAEAGRFGALVSRVESARTPAAYASLAGPVLAEVDSLEAVFTK